MKEKIVGTWGRGQSQLAQSQSSCWFIGQVFVLPSLFSACLLALLTVAAQADVLQARKTMSIVRQQESAARKAAGAGAIQAAIQMRETDRRVAQRLLKAAATQSTMGARMRVISQNLLGLPYVINPLEGSLTQPEQFNARLDGFDCVTFMETVLALARSRTPAEFVSNLRRIRYENGLVDYRARLHYTTNWHRANVRQGILQDLTQGAAGSVIRNKTLSLLPGFAPQPTSYRIFPKTQRATVSHWVQDGDLVYFASSKEGLDTYHVGILFRVGTHIVLRHASRSQREVIEQDFAEFCQQNRMAGFIVARPVEQW